MTIDNIQALTDGQSGITFVDDAVLSSVSVAQLLSASALGRSSLELHLQTLTDGQHGLTLNQASLVAIAFNTTSLDNVISRVIQTTTLTLAEIIINVATNNQLTENNVAGTSS